MAINMNVRKTGKLSDTRPVKISTAPAKQGVDIGLLRPWRIGFIVKGMGVKIVTDMTESIILGRIAPDGSDVPIVDLRPFDADTAGVSRKHLMIKAEGEGVYVADLDSANGTRLNNTKLEPNKFVPLHHDDLLTLGLLELQVELLVDPLA